MAGGMTSRTPPAVLALALLAAGSASAEEFAPLAGFERIRGAAALAIDPASGRVAVGTARSVWLAAPGAAAERALSAGDVRDLVFSPRGALWVASDRGVFEIDAGIAT